jgi:hypothetical protein
MRAHAAFFSFSLIWQLLQQCVQSKNYEACSSDSIVSEYRLDDRGRGKEFSSSLCVQTSSEAHPASYQIGTRGPFPGGKARAGCDTDHSPASSADVKNE